MSTIQYSARIARSYIIYCLSPFRHVAVLTFAVLVYRRFDHTPTSSGHAHLDHQRTYDMACRVTRVTVNGCRTSQRIWGRFLVRSVHSKGNDSELIPTVIMKTRHPVEKSFGSEFPLICNQCGIMDA